MTVELWQERDEISERVGETAKRVTENKRMRGFFLNKFFSYNIG